MVQIEPREQEIVEMKAQVAKMDQELATYHSINTSLNLQIGSLQSKLAAAEAENSALREKNMALRTMVSRFRADVSLAITDVQNPKSLAEALKALYDKYCS